MIFGVDVAVVTVNWHQTYLYMSDGRVIVCRSGETIAEGIARGEEWPHRGWLPAVIDS